MELPAEDIEDIILSSIVRLRTDLTRCRYKARTGSGTCLPLANTIPRPRNATRLGLCSRISNQPRLILKYYSSSDALPTLAQVAHAFGPLLALTC